MNTTQPRWQDLFAKLLMEEHQDAIVSEVELYQAQPALGLDLGLAWNEAVLPGVLLAEDDARVSARFPSAWNSASHLNLTGPFPCCVGLAPQFLQKIDRFMEDATGFFQQETPIITSNCIAEATLDSKTPLSQLAIARLAGDAEQINRLIPQLDGELLQKNEQAAQLWLTGSREEARQLWDSLPGDEAVIAFNQGLAALASGDTKRGQECLNRAVDGFEESTGWHHLAELYLAVIE